MTIGTMTKMISKASSTKAQSPMTPSTTATASDVAAGDGGDQIVDQPVGAEQAQHQRERGRRDQQREQRAGDRHGVVQQFAQHRRRAAGR